MAQLIPFRGKGKVDNLNAYLDQVSSLSEIEEYERMIERLKDRGKLSGIEAKRLALTLKKRKAILKQ